MGKKQGKKHDDELLSLLINDAHALAHHSGDIEPHPDCDHKSEAALVAEYMDAAVRILEWQLGHPDDWLPLEAFRGSLNGPGCCSEMMEHVANRLVERGTIRYQRWADDIHYGGV